MSKIPPKKPGIKKTPVKKVETKSEIFIRLAAPRVQKVLKSFRILGNCSNRTNYEYSAEQIEKMFNKIDEAYVSLVSSFTPSKQEQENFSF